MTQNKIDLSFFKNKKDTSPIIMKLFSGDEDLMIIFSIIHNEQPITLPEIGRVFNKLFTTSYTKSWFDYKLKKIFNFCLYEKTSVLDCNSDSEIHTSIKNKHKEWIVRQRINKNFGEYLFSKATYYYLTEKGEGWIPFIEDRLNKRKNEISQMSHNATEKKKVHPKIQI